MSSPTRGYGILEGWLARRRAAMARNLMPKNFQHLRLLDIGCGVPPMFLLSTEAQTKTGLDLRADGQQYSGIRMIAHDCSMLSPLPCNDDSMDTVTMLATVEHVPPPTLPYLLTEAYRILAPNGRIIITTPARHAQKLLRLMAYLRLVSREEIGDHRKLYRIRELRNLLMNTGFAKATIRHGLFELGCNHWIVGDKHIASAGL